MIDKILQTLCAIANIGPLSFGHLLIGVADKKRDADRIREIDGVLPINISERFVVGIEREAARESQTIEEYFTIFREKIRNSKLSDPLRHDILAGMKMVNYHGRIVLHLPIISQSNLSFYDDKVYFREADQTKIANPKTTVFLSQRF